uniref:NADP-dependent oxidoreductase domain-containing protein n=1 Tax=Panagrolaimus superbus TaxID=310955 RepID=A0A914Z3Z8_9BILA
MANTTTIKLLDGNDIPLFGLGTYKIVEQNEVNQAVDAALGAGYRLFDTAKFYLNEPQLGIALKELLPKHSLSRKDVFITTKIWPSLEDNYNVTIKGVKESLDNLQTDYIDLVLIHFPKANERNEEDGVHNKQARKEMWQALEEVKAKKFVRSIGVSNFYPRHIEEFKEFSSQVPALNQVEFHPHFTRPEIRAYCKEHNIAFQGYSVLARFNKDLVEDSTVKAIAEKNNTSVEIILLSFLTSQGFPVIAKSVTPSRIQKNITALNLKLSDEDIDKLYGLDKNHNYIRGTPWLVQ